ncbi:MAG: PEP-utilizing enzyme [Ardenticatenaceae bacterium]|nr:PEP-utilizing enzyme [Ardenticatenaceae bacterium]
MAPALAAEICTAARTLLAQGASALAVRSSAVAEDLDGASFAGLQQTVLGLTDAAAIPAAVEEVWASLQSPEARAYRAHLGAALPVAMAVIVQSQVAAQAAGVVFARDPLSGEDTVVVEAIAGLGEALVSGRADPLTWRLVGGDIAYRPAAPAHGRGDAASLPPDDVVRQVAVLVEQVSALFGAPQDVEWAWDGRRLWLLQARPITGLVEDFFTDRLPGDDFLWTAAFLNERFTQPVSPLGWSLVAAPLANLAFGEPLRLIGAVDFGKEPLLKLWCGHPYSRVAAWQRLYKLFPGWALPEDAARYFPLGDTTLRRAPRVPRWGPHLLRNTLAVLWREGRAALPWSNPGTWRRYEGEQAAWLARLRVEATGLSHLPPDERQETARRLLREAQALTERLLAIHRWSLFWTDLLFSLLRRVLQALTDHATGTRLAAELTAGGGSHTARLNQAVSALATRASARPAIKAALAGAETVADLAALSGPDSPFVRAVWTFLDAYGHRFFSLDLSDPPYRAAPRQLFDLILTVAEAGRADERRQAGDTSASLFPCSLPLLFLRSSGLLALTRRYLRLREDQRFRWQELLAFQRGVALDLGVLWTGAGHLETPEHVFGLTWQELLDAAPDAALGQRAARRFLRLQVLRRQAALAPGWHYPDFLRGNRPLRQEQGGGTLRGRPVSPGIARGPARLVASPADFVHLTPGDILVTTSPDPGWTPIFPTIAALITERGGQLSHGAVVAREYSLPAVSGISGVMGLIQEGEELLVDGTQGVVVRLSTKSGRGGG